MPMTNKVFFFLWTSLDTKTFSFFNKIWDSKMAQWVRVPAMEADNLCSVPRAHSEGLLTHTWAMAHVCPHTHYNKIRSNQGNQPDGIRLLPENTLLRRSQFGCNILQSTGTEIKTASLREFTKYSGVSLTLQKKCYWKNIFSILDSL